MFQLCTLEPITWMFVLIILILCIRITDTVPVECLNCKCCADEKCGQYKTFENGCPKGCKDGYRGGRCYTKCNSHCKACDMNDWNCTECPDGYYPTGLNGCTYRCPPNCKTCTSATSCNVCKDGYYSPLNTYLCSATLCPENCECNSTKCVSCKNGFHGHNTECRTACPVNCISCSSGDACGRCKDGYYNEYLFDERTDIYSHTCTNECRKNCKKCSSFNECLECVGGTFGSKCQQKCSIGCEGQKCKADTGYCNCTSNFAGEYCSECADGKFGNNCNQPCSAYCKNNVCEKLTGYCKHGCINDNFSDMTCSSCIIGKFGNFCNQTCSRNCKHNTCDEESGECSGGCKGNFDGLTCNECITGKFGNECKQECTPRCVANKCDKNSGNCVNCNRNFAGNKCELCAPGFFGDSCEEICPAQCNNKTCTSKTGVCVYGCIGNYSGDKCCANNFNCEICSTYTDCRECKSGYFHKTCDTKCPRNCASSCNLETGECGLCKKDYYGPVCNETCPKHCKSNNETFESSCDFSLGTCRFGCFDGYFGQICNKTCSSYCISNLCVQETGQCSIGCNNTFRGNECGIFSDTKHSNTGSTDEIVPIVVTLISITVFVIGILTAIVFIRRRNKKEQDSDDSVSERTAGHNESRNDRIYANVEHQEVQHYANISQAHESVSSTHSSQHGVDEEVKGTPSMFEENLESSYYDYSEKRIPLSSLFQYVSDTSMEEFEDQFWKLPQDLTMPYTISQKPNNISLNRFNRIYPYDHSRVIIHGQPRFFINACYIDGYKKKKAYIASLGPTAKTTDTFATFWQMVWNEESNIIVMLTNLHETTGMKCEQYWPNQDTSDIYGDIKLTCHSVEQFAEYTVRTFTMSKAGEKSRNLYHLHFTAWPDKGVPDDVTSLIEFRQRVKAVPAALKGPLIVHCSAGIGRTGTYIALDQLAEEGMYETSIDVFSCLTRMRAQRVNMVQTLEQYMFVHNALVHCLTFDSEALSAEEIQQLVPKTSDSSFDRKFQNLKRNVETGNKEDNEARLENVRKYASKNRGNADVPGDHGRVHLHLNRNPGDPDFINAVYVNSFKLKDHFIVAQTPLPATVQDFICMIYQQDCSCIVSFDDMASRRKDVGKYVPTENRQFSVGDFIVTSKTYETKPQYNMRKLIVHNKGQYQIGQKVAYHFQYTQWGAGKHVPDDVEAFVVFVRDVEKYAMEKKEKSGHVLVHCLNGCERSGLFCVVTTLLEKLDIERRVNVENTIRKIRTHRKLAIPNMEQLKFCYESLRVYLEMYNTYSNYAV